MRACVHACLSLLTETPHGQRNGEKVPRCHGDAVSIMSRTFWTEKPSDGSRGTDLGSVGDSGSGLGSRDLIGSWLRGGGAYLNKVVI